MQDMKGGGRYKPAAGADQIKRFKLAANGDKTKIEARYRRR